MLRFKFVCKVAPINSHLNAYWLLAVVRLSRTDKYHLGVEQFIRTPDDNNVRNVIIVTLACLPMAAAIAISDSNCSRQYHKMATVLSRIYHGLLRYVFPTTSCRTLPDKNTTTI